MANGGEPAIQSDLPGSVAPAPSALPTLKRRAAQGAAWLMAQSIGAKVISLLGQIVIARILNEREFGFVGLAYIVPTFVGLVQQGGLREILVRRQRRLHLWESAAFWLSVVQGLVSLGAMLVLAPVVNRYFMTPEDAAKDSTLLTHLIWILAIQSFIGALGIVPETKLNIDLRFKFLAVLGTFQAVSTIGLTIVLALLGFGAYSYIVPVPVVGLIRVAAMWWADPPRIRWRLEIRKWAHMFTDSWMIFITSVCYVITWQADYIIIGRLHSKEVVGSYFWAFNLSTQAMTVLVLNMSGVMFAALGKLAGQRERQRSAFVRGARTTAALAVPICFLQAVLADAGVRLVFKSNWWDAIGLVQILSVAGAFQSAAFLAFADLKAAGRFREMMWLMIAFACGFVGMVYAGASLGAATGAAVGVCVYHAITGPTALWLTLTPGSGRLRHLAEIFARPILFGALAAGAGLLVDRSLAGLPHGSVNLLVRLASTSAAFAVVYAGLSAWLAADLREEAAPVLRRLAARVGWGRTRGT